MGNSARRPRAGSWTTQEPVTPVRLIVLAGCASLITVLFIEPIARLLSLALQNELHSHIPLVPFISAYLLYTHRRTAVAYRSSVGAAGVAAALGLVLLAAATRFSGIFSANDHLSLLMLSYLSFLVAGAFLCLGSRWMRAAAFPVSLLAFIVPIPDGAVIWLEDVLVAGSTEAAAFLFTLTGTPLYREGTTLTLPGIVLEVARECSGIRSSVVLFITSLVAAHVFLRSGWRRSAVVAFVMPLAIARNGLRILVIGLLCVYIGPHMADSYIHRSGGPIFFALSLVPLALLLLGLRTFERRAETAHA